MDIRETRDILPLRGIGGFLEFEWVTASSPPRPGSGERIEVRQWEIEHLYRNVEIPMSGGKGSISRRRVADDFRFTAIIPLDLRPVKKNPPAPGPNSQPFYDGRFQGDPLGNFHIGIKFQCGDPTFWSDPNSNTIARPEIDPARPGVFYFCEAILLEQVSLLTTPAKELVYQLKGSGSAPLERHVDTLHCGEGAFAFGVPE